MGAAAGGGQEQAAAIGVWADALTTRSMPPSTQTGAKASSPRSRRVWCAQRVILRATERAARLPPARLRAEWVALGGGGAVVEQRGVQALDPAGVLVAQIFEQLEQRAQLGDLLGRDPRLRQSPTGQQVPQVSGVEPVGLRAALRAP